MRDVESVPHDVRRDGWERIRPVFDLQADRELAVIVHPTDLSAPVAMPVPRLQGIAHTQAFPSQSCLNRYSTTPCNSLTMPVLSSRQRSAYSRNFWCKTRMSIVDVVVLPITKLLRILWNESRHYAASGIMGTMPNKEISRIEDRLLLCNRNSERCVRHSLIYSSVSPNWTSKFRRCLYVALVVFFRSGDDLAVSLASIRQIHG